MDARVLATLAAAAGAACQEVVHWYDLRDKLTEPQYQQEMASPAYWVVTGLMIVVSGIGTALLYGARLDIQKTPDAFFILGAAFPALFKQLYASAGTRTTLGAQNPIQTYFLRGVRQSK
jgi:hypothetical protein